jgi:phosphoglycolate phosphatase
VFDFDGTLAPNLDLPGMRREVIALTRTAGVPDAVFADQYIVEIIDVSTAWLHTRDPQGAERYRQRAHQLITDLELDAARDTTPFPRVRNMLDALRGAGLGIAVVTRNCAAAVRTVFADIDGYCDTVLTRDDVAHLKPDARHLGAALEHLDIPGHLAIMVGDGRMDMEIGRALGLRCVGVLSGSSDVAALRAAGAHLVIDSAEDLPDHL